MDNNVNLTVGEIVAEDFRTASVFSEYGIDFCCRGDKTIQEVCDKKSINVAELQNKLDEITQHKSGDVDFNSWSLDLLTDYVEKTHHRYIREKTPSLLQFLNKIQKVHGERHPELLEIYELFSQSASDLEFHMQKEERVLFPYIRQMVEAKNSGQPLERGHFGTVQNPIASMKEDHSKEGERFAKMSELSGGFTVPADGCNTYRVAFAMLDEFDKDLHKHIHLENNILYPKAIDLEQSL
jgi:regulator of cell morphogenesis and NO signaling